MNNDPATQPDLTNYREQYSHYAKRLLSDLGLGEVGQPERNQLLVAIESYVQQILVSTLLENLTPEMLDEVDAIIERGGDQDQVITHLISTIPDMDIKISEALAAAYARMLHESRELTSAIVAATSTNTSADTSVTTGSEPGSEPSPTADTPTNR